MRLRLAESNIVGYVYVKEELLRVLKFSSEALVFILIIVTMML
jgi:hypothetical protein